MKKGTIWMSAGLLLLSAALCLTIYNVWDEKRAKEAVEQVTERLEETISREGTDVSGEAYRKYPEMEMPSEIIDGVRYIGVLEIPELQLTLPVIREWSSSNAKIAPCCYTGSVYTKNIVIAGHNYKTHFAKLAYLTGGESVYFTDVDGNSFTYQVVEIEVLSQDAVEAMKTGDWDLTLFTCTYSGRARTTIRCKMLS